MKVTINVSDFRDAFHRCGRGSQFSYEGLAILFDYLEECETDIGEEWELDVIALCCDFAEESWKAIAENYSIELTDTDDDEEKMQAVMDCLTDEGVFIGITGENIVYRQF
jgi:predicted ArsR family transcriptional regulator